jgi:hypothetical protein
MNARQEIEQILEHLRDAESHVQIDRLEGHVDRIREILATHELVPIDDAIGLRRECLALIEEAERRAKDNSMGDVAYRNAIQRLKLFLRDGKTTFHEERDDSPFDPGRCGFKLNNIDVWKREGISISIFEDRMTVWGGSERVYFDDKLEMDRPVHPMGVALLKGLGLEVEVRT